MLVSPNYLKNRKTNMAVQLSECNRSEGEGEETEEGSLLRLARKM